MNKNNIFKALCISAALLFGAHSAQAQIEQSVYLNGSIPTAQFNDPVAVNMTLNQPMTKAQYGQAASVGIGLGYRVGYVFDIGFGYVTPFLNADLQWNQIKSSVRDEFTSARCDIPQYFNIPIMLGVNYRYELTDVFTLFGEFGLGDDIFIGTQEGWTNILYKYKTSSAMAWEIGAGSFFGDHVSLGIHYYGLGKHSIDYSNHDNSADPVVTRKMGSLALRIGFHF